MADYFSLEDIKTKSEKPLKKQALEFKRTLDVLNVIVASVHLTSFVVLTIISFIFLPTTRTVGLWIEVDSGTTILDLGTYPIFATLLPFPFITAVFHILARLGVDNYYRDVIMIGRNRLRWIEYSITNGLMTFSLVVLVGGGNVITLAVCVLANIVMQYFGYLHEDYYHNSVVKSPKFIIVGFLPWIQIWAVIFTYYSINFDSLALYDGFAVIGSFLWSLAFVIPLCWRYPKENTARNNLCVEIFYIVLSLTAKLYLDWTVTIGYLSQN